MTGALMAGGPAAASWPNRHMGGLGLGSETHQAVHQAMAAHDYAAFKTAVGDKLPAGMTEEKFNQLADNLAGRKDKFLAKHPGVSLDAESAAAFKTALEQKDYDAWKKIVGDKAPLGTLITKDNFGLFVDRHNLMRAGKFKEAEELRVKLGLPEMKMKRLHSGRKIMKGVRAERRADRTAPEAPQS